MREALGIAGIAALVLLMVAGWLKYRRDKRVRERQRLR